MKTSKIVNTIANSFIVPSTVTVLVSLGALIGSIGVGGLSNLVGVIGSKETHPLLEPTQDMGRAAAGLGAAALLVRIMAEFAANRTEERIEEDENDGWMDFRPRGTTRLYSFFILKNPTQVFFYPISGGPSESVRVEDNKLPLLRQHFDINRTDKLVGKTAEIFAANPTEALQLLFIQAQEVAWRQELQERVNRLERNLQQDRQRIVEIRTQIEQTTDRLDANSSGRPAACKSCKNYHGQTYGGNFFNCAIHPSGPVGEECPDIQI
jgi:hypothetical protein